MLLTNTLYILYAWIVKDEPRSAKLETRIYQYIFLSRGGLAIAASISSRFQIIIAIPLTFQFITVSFCSFPIGYNQYLSSY